MRKLYRRLVAVLVPTTVVAVSVVSAGVAEATNCGQPCFSDRRLKTNIRPIQVPDERTVLERVRELQGVTWDWRDPRHGTRGIGLVAQDVARAFPDAVSTGEDGYLRVDYHGLVGVLVEAVQELADRVEELERRGQG